MRRKRRMEASGLRPNGGCTRHDIQATKHIRPYDQISRCVVIERGYEVTVAENFRHKQQS